MTKENKTSNEILDNMYHEVKKVVGNFKGDVINAQKEEIKALEIQIKKKWSDKRFVLMKRDDLRDLMDGIEDARNYTLRAEEEASSCTYAIEEVQSQSDYANGELSSVYDRLEEFSAMHEEVETEKGELNE